LAKSESEYRSIFHDNKVLQDEDFSEFLKYRQRIGKPVLNEDTPVVRDSRKKVMQVIGLLVFGVPAVLSFVLQRSDSDQTVKILMASLLALVVGAAVFGLTRVFRKSRPDH